MQLTGHPQHPFLPAVTSPPEPQGTSCPGGIRTAKVLPRYCCLGTVLLVALLSPINQVHAGSLSGTLPDFRPTLVAEPRQDPSTEASQTDSESDPPSLGVTRMIEQIVLPGTELTHRPVDPTQTPLVVRVVETYPHGDAFRYDISYFGLTPGNYDLREFLIRIDGSSTEDLPPIPVTIRSILDEGQIEPNELEIGQLSRYGGYWQLVIIGAVVWALVLLALVWAGLKKQQPVAEQVDVQPTLADLLRPAVEKAVAGTLPPEKHAELERLLLAFWQKRLRLENLEPAEALQQIRNDEQAGPLVRQLERWLHSPPGTNQTPDIAELLKPYRSFDADELETVSVAQAGTEPETRGGPAA